MKVFMLFLVASILPLIIFSSSMLRSFKNHYIEDQIGSMYREAHTISTNLLLVDYFEGINNRMRSIEIIEAFTEGRIIIVNQSGIVFYDSNGNDIGKLYVSDEIIEGLRGGTNDYFDNETYTAKVIVPVKKYTTKQVDGLIVITREFVDVKDSMNDITGLAIVAIIGITVLFIAISFYVSNLITRPFGQIIQYINQSTHGLTDEKLEIRGNYEAERISNAFNEMLEKIWEADSNRQQFVSNVSHELKTPLTSMKILAESLLGQEEVPNELYREFLVDINSEINREKKIIDDLLSLVTLDKKQSSMNIEVVNINVMVERIMRRLKPLAEEKNLQMIYESHRLVEAEVDGIKMESAISNLIDNAIKYNKDDGSVRVILDSNHQDFKLKVYNTGEGIPADSVDKVFKRFYRVDKTRSRDTGGTGLGLSIVSDTVILHNGKVMCKSDESSYCEFILTIPIRYSL